MPPYFTLTLESKMFDFIIKFFIVMSVLGWMPGQNMIFFDKNFFAFSSLCVLLSAFFFGKKKRLWNENYSYIIGIISIIAILNCFRSGFTNINYITSFIFLISNVILIYQYISDYKSCIKWIVISGLINISLFYFQFAGYNPIFPCQDGFYGGHMGNIARFASYIAIIFPFMIEYGALCFLITLCTFFFGAQKQLPIIGAAYIVLFFKLTNKWIKYIYLSIFIFILIFFYNKIHHSIFSVRFPVWEHIFQIFKQYPIFGIGMSWTLNSDITRDFQCQSSLFYYIIGSGIVAIIPIILIIISYIKNFKTTSLNISLLIFMLLSLIEYPFEIRRLWFTLACIISFYLIETSERIFNENSQRKVYGKS